MPVNGLSVLGGWLGLICGLIAMYTSFGLVTNAAFGKPVIPLAAPFGAGERGRTPPAGGEYAHGVHSQRHFPKSKYQRTPRGPQRSMEYE